MSDTSGSSAGNAGVNRTIALVGGIITALVGINTMAVSCSNQRLAQNAAFHERMDAEEQKWLSNFGKLETVADLDVSDPKRIAKLNILDSINQSRNDRIDLFGKEYCGTTADDPAQDSMECRRVKYLAKIWDDYASATVKLCSETPDCQRGERDFDKEEQAIKEAVAAPQQAPTAVEQLLIATPQAVAARQNTLQLTPSSANRWDIDVFWCDRDNSAAADQNFANALLVGNLLRDMVNKDQAIGGDSGGQKLGRIRVRILPNSKQKPGSGYPSQGNEVRYNEPKKAEDTKSVYAEEKRLARALAEKTWTDPLSKKSITFTMPEKGVTTQTPWYLSLFVCSV
jgi:hypothetical protein